MNVAGLLLGRASGRVAGDRGPGGARRHALAPRAAAAHREPRAGDGRRGPSAWDWRMSPSRRSRGSVRPTCRACQMIAVNGPGAALYGGRDARQRAAVRSRAGAAARARRSGRRAEGRRPHDGRRAPSAAAAGACRDGSRTRVRPRRFERPASAQFRRNGHRRIRDFEPAGALTASVELPTARYDTDGGRRLLSARAPSAFERCQAFEKAAFSSDLPWTGYDENTSFSIVGRQFPDREGPEARYHFITLRLHARPAHPLIAGRELTQSDGRWRTTRSAGERSRGDASTGTRQTPPSAPV